MSIEFIRNAGGEELRPRISVIGVGGAGGNAIANMIAADVAGVEFVVANTDAQALNVSRAETRIQLGPRITEGLGAGSRPEIGRAAAEETLEQIEASLDGAHMCFIAAGMGGGTGTGAAPVIAEAARKRGILTVGVVTKPFSFEGSRRMKSAEAGIDELQKNVDTLIVIPNQNLFLIANPETTFKEAFQMADEVLQQGVRGITDLMVQPGLINLDFADVRTVMEEMGKAMMGTGEADGADRAREAAERAIANPLLDGVSMRGAKGVIISITGGDDMRLMEVDEAANYIKELVDPDANIIWGSAFNNDLDGKLRVSVVATGIEVDARAEPAPARVFAFPTARERVAPMRRPEPSVPMAETPGSSAMALSIEATEVIAVPEAAEAPRLDPPEQEGVEIAPPPIAAEAPDADAAELPSPIVFDDLATVPTARPNTPPRPTFTVRSHGGEARTVSREQAAPSPSATPEEELVLDGASMRAATQPDAADTGSRRWLAKGETRHEPEITPAEEPQRQGLSLFERVSGLARGAAKAENRAAQTGGEEIDIPRFLNRQGNQ